MLIMMLKDLRISPLRTFLTGFSMLIGICAMVCSVLVGSVGADYLRATNAQLYGYAPSIRASISDTDFRDSSKTSRFIEALSDDHVSRTGVFQLDQDLRFTAVPAGSSVDDAGTQALDRALRVETVLTTPTYASVYNLPQTSGRWFTSGDSESGLDIVVNKIGADTYPLGTRLLASQRRSMNMTPFQVVGVVNDGGDEPRFYINTMPLVALAPNLGHIRDVSILLFNKNASPAGSVRSSIEDLLHDTVGGKINDLSGHNSSSFYEDVIAFLQLAFAVSAGLLLFVSVIGLINIGLASIEQRMHELLVRRAIGASRGSIAALVMGSLVLLSMVVSVIAIGLSVVAVQCFPLMLPHDTPVSAPVFPVMAAVVAVACSIATALLGGIIPAVKASRLQPALALR